MPSQRPCTGNEPAEVIVDSEDDGESGAESFLTDDELSYREGRDPAEDDDFLQDEEPAASPNQTRSLRGRGRKRSRSPLQAQPQPAASATSWRTERDPDVCPDPKRFIPARPPGHQLNSSSVYRPLDLFKLFFSNDAAQTVCQNTNKQAARNITKGKKYSWTDINIQEFFRYLGLTFFFALVKLNNTRDYWKKNSIFSVPFPANVMARDRDNRRGCPCSHSNALKKKDPRGSIRWIRDDPLVFVKWLDKREVAVCSTIHQAFSGNTVQRRVKNQDGSWSTKSIPCPTPVMEYNKHMGAVDLSDQLIQYNSQHHKSVRWYRILFYHFLDIAATNSFLLHKELCREKQEAPMTYRAFLEELTAQLCGVTVTDLPAKVQGSHLPVAVSNQTDPSRRASYGRKTCVYCRQTRQVNLSTPWKCKSCDVALCLIADRNCFEAWHS
ncbi:piggyBac transposable element-derived protein 4-like protein [Lates japonicus]|uniref:PiggyBac transposable element-derived protein 4-like protein n=1 Tax=Lates japonicus TaxID=270547 RepID=A0AAD3MUI2_LATJO|nr:piggyBac transposable element-derived protein 4-like protein [Lates japonicus]